MGNLPTNPTESVKRRNPNLYGSQIRPAILAVETIEPKRGSRPPLDSPRPKRKRGKGCVECIVTLIAVRKREADDDNNIASLKGCRDAITYTLGLDDGDGRLRWQYGQCETRGQEGVIVKIELL